MKAFNLFYRKTAATMLIAVLPFICDTANAQLKLYSNGNLSIGSITQPPPAAELQVIGNTVFSKTTLAITSSAYIKGFNSFSTDSLPDYSWWGDTLTGIFHPLVNVLAFTNAGRETMRLSPANNLLIGSASDNGDRMQGNRRLEYKSPGYILQLHYQRRLLRNKLAERYEDKSMDRKI
jgi:hypothetical protein